MATNLANEARGSFLVEVLYCAGWQLRVRNGDVVRIHAKRAGVELEVTGATLADAAGTAFARAMRSSRRRNGGG